MRFIIVWDNHIISKSHLTEMELEHAKLGLIMIIDKVEMTFYVEGNVWQKISEK